MNKKILYKLLLIFALLVCTLFISNTKCFALHTTTKYNSSYIDNSDDPISAIHSFIDNKVANNINYTSEDLPPYQLIYKTTIGSNIYYTFLAVTHPVLYSSDSTESLLKLYYSSVSTISYSYVQITFRPTEVSISEDLLTYSDKDDSNGYAVDFAYSSSGSMSLFASNYDIYDENNELVFPQPPVEEETPVEEKQEITLAPIVEEVETEKTLMEVVGILPLIIVVVVSLVGLRKALKILLTVLKRA